MVFFCRQGILIDLSPKLTISTKKKLPIFLVGGFLSYCSHAYMIATTLSLILAPLSRLFSFFILFFHRTENLELSFLFGCNFRRVRNLNTIACSIFHCFVILWCLNCYNLNASNYLVFTHPSILLFSGLGKWYLFLFCCIHVHSINPHVCPVGL